MKIILLVFIIIFVSNPSMGQEYSSDFNHSSVIKSTKKIKKGGISYVTLRDGEKIVKVEVACNCEKDTKNDKLIIQIVKYLPAKSSKNQYLNEFTAALNRFSMDYSVYNDSINFQKIQLTIFLSKNVVDSIMVKRASQEPEFDGLHNLEDRISYFNVELSNTNYKIASDIWGVVKLKMPIPFGWTDKDYIINTYFKCNNWRVNKTLEIPQFKNAHN